MEPIFRAQAIHDGISDERLRAAVRNDELVRLRSGAYVPAAYRELHAEERHRLIAFAALPSLHAESVLSHISAAVLHGLPIWGTDVRRVHVTRPGIPTRRTKRTRFYGHPLGPDDVEWIDGVRVTSLNRTLVDVARTLPLAPAVVVGDAAVRRGAQIPSSLERHRGNKRARRTLAFVDGRSESPGESRSRVLLHLTGLPAPLLQVEIAGCGARADFCWPEFGLVGEFDGMMKYKAIKGEDSSIVVSREKRREDRLRAAGWNVVRWVWDDLDAPAQLIGDLRRRLIERVGAPSPWRTT